MDLPKVKFGEHEITRLIIGGNPFCGNSHFSAESNSSPHHLSLRSLSAVEQQYMSFVSHRYRCQTSFDCGQTGARAEEENISHQWSLSA